MLKKNDTIRLDIVDITNLGFGVGRHEGQVVFVADCVTGDVIDAQIIKVNKSYAVGRVKNIIKKSELRCDGRCDVAGCKSCTYRLIGYDSELAMKKKLVEGCFIREGLVDVTVEDVVASPALLGYRNKAQYPVSITKDGEYVIGFFAPKSHRVTEARRCPLAPPEFAEIIDTVAYYFKKNAVSVYDEESGRGLIRHIYLRRGEVSGEVLLTLVINGKSLPDEEGLVKLITDKFSDVVGILINSNEVATNVVLGEVWRTLYGRDYIYDTLGGVRLKITAPSFYQVNRAAADMLYSKARELAAPTKDDLLLDLYCGAGSIGLSMADEAGEIIGIEIVESAVECAKFNAEINGISNASFYAGDAADTAKLLAPAEKIRREKIKPDIVILDPPRGGSDATLFEHIASLSPRKIIYISCNPTTLARDMVILRDCGYESNKVTPYDLFPATGHVESVVCLTRKNKQ